MSKQDKNKVANVLKLVTHVSAGKGMLLWELTRDTYRLEKVTTSQCSLKGGCTTFLSTYKYIKNVFSICTD